jgi:hypothetical protein
MINASDARVRGHQLVRQIRDRKLHRVIIEHRWPKRKPRRRPKGKEWGAARSNPESFLNNSRRRPVFLLS